MVDKNLFLYDLAVVAIMKNEAPYVKEWLDYHLLAGVEHFYIYDNDSPDNLKEVLQPYIDAGIVTYTFYPGKVMQCSAYHDAACRFRFFCRYAAFIDGDEFILPQDNRSITENLDDIFSKYPDASGLSINWHMYGSNYQEKADYSKGVLERFTKRCPKNLSYPIEDERARLSNSNTKSINNLRAVRYFHDPHYPTYYNGLYKINEDGEKVEVSVNYPVTDKKFCINHYIYKSHEEYLVKVRRGDAYFLKKSHTEDTFMNEIWNDEFDDSILKYRDYRQSLGLNLHKINHEKLVAALIKNLSPMLQENVSPEIFQNKMETFLTCRALTAYLKENFLGKERGELIENLALRGVYSTLFTNISGSDIEMLFAELPNILQLNYPVVEDIRKRCIEMIPEIQVAIRTTTENTGSAIFWRDFFDFDKTLKFLKIFDSYEHK